MKRYLHVGFVGALIVGFVGNNVRAENELDIQTIIEESKITLNAENVSEIPQLPIVFEGITYQPDEYAEYFEKGLEITVHLIQDVDNDGNDVLYAFLPEVDSTRGVRKGFGFLSYEINGNSNDFTQNCPVPNLTFSAFGSYQVLIFTIVKWKLYRNGTKIDEKTQPFFGFGSGITSVTFTKPFRPGTYTIEKEIYWENQISPSITVTLANQNADLCPFGWYDGANCYIMPKPWNGFIWHNKFYVRPTSGNSCPSTVHGYSTYFGGFNCHILSAPFGTTAFEYSGNFYTTPKWCQ